MTDADLKYILSVSADMTKAQADMLAFVNNMTQQGRTAGQNIIAGMSAAARSPSASQMMIAGMSAAGQQAAQVVAAQATAAQQSAEAAERRMKFIGGLGKAAAGYMIGSEAGLAGVGSLVAGGVTPAAVVMAAVDIVKGPFEIMARAAENNVAALHALNSSAGIAAVGLTRAANTMRYIPLIGESLARMKESQRAELEANVGFVARYSPAVARQLQMATEDLQAARGRRELENITNQTRATQLAGAIEATEGADNYRRREGQELGRHGWGLLNRLFMSERERLAQEIEDAKSGKGLTEKEEQELRERYKKATGRELESAAGMASRPTQTLSYAQYAQQFYEGVYSQGAEGNRPGTAILEDIARLLTQIRDQNARTGGGFDPADLGDGMDRMMEGMQQRGGAGAVNAFFGGAEG